MMTPSNNTRPENGSKEWIALVFEQCGFHRSVAGDDDFNLAVEGVFLAHEKHKNILISGPCGCGKTALSKILQRLFKVPTFLYMANPCHVRWLEPDNEYGDYRTHEYMQSGCVIDDVGIEPTQNVYGIKREIVGEFLAAEYIFGRGRIIMNTNLNSDEFTERYDARIQSRVKEKFIPIKLTGNDKRKWEKIK